MYAYFLIIDTSLTHLRVNKYLKEMGHSIEKNGDIITKQLYLQDSL